MWDIPAWMIVGGCASVAVAAGGLAGSVDPLLVLGAAAGTAFVGLCMMKPAIPLLALIALGPLEGASLAASEDGLSLTKVVGLLCFASFALHVAMTRRRLVLDVAQGLVIAILGLAIVSSLQAHDSAMALTTSIRYASFVILFLIVTQFADRPGVLRAIAWTLSVSASVAALLGLGYYFSGSFFVATLPYANPNDYAFMLATTLPLTVWLVRFERYRTLSVVMVVTIGSAMMLSFSRGAALGLAAWVGWMIVSSRRRFFPILATVLVVGTTFLLAVRTDPARFQTGLELKEAIADENVQTRIAAWRGALSLVADDPWLGVGPGNFRLHFFEATGRPPGTENLFVVHNAYLDVAAEVGLFAAICFIAYVVLQLTRLNRLRREKRGDPPGLAEALQGALIIAAVSALTLSEQYFAPFWLLGAMTTCLWTSALPSDDAR